MPDAHFEWVVPYQGTLERTMNAVWSSLEVELDRVRQEGWKPLRRGLVIFDDPDMGGYRVKFGARR